jgi:hypothetical protein
MKVKDLLHRLSCYNPEQEVLFGCTVEKPAIWHSCMYQGSVDVFECEQQMIMDDVVELEETLDRDILETIQCNKKLVVIHVNGNENYIE